MTDQFDKVIKSCDEVISVIDKISDKYKSEHKEPRFWFHWQNLNEKPFGHLGWGLRYGRCWWNFSDRRCIGLEWNFRSHFFHLEFEIGDEWKFAFALPYFALWLHFEGFRILQRLTPKKKCIATWDNNREFTIPDRRECGISIHNWTIWFKIGR